MSQLFRLLHICAGYSTRTLAFNFTQLPSGRLEQLVELTRKKLED